MDTLKKLMDLLFLVTMLLYVALAGIIVLGQVISLFSLNRTLCEWFYDTFLIPACVSCGCTSLLSFVMSYLYRWKSND